MKNCILNKVTYNIERCKLYNNILIVLLIDVSLRPLYSLEV
jgi:hypothetical protein